MKRKLALLCSFTILCLISLFGCDPIYPIGNIKVSRIGSIPVGETVDVEILYPNTGGSIVFGWEEQNIIIVSGDDVISISGLAITGIKAGTAVIQVCAKTVISEEAQKQGYEAKVYSIEIKVKVIGN